MLLVSHIPLASLIALIVSWIGLGFFFTKINQGIISVRELSQELISNFTGYLDRAQAALLIFGVIMAIITCLMALVGICATRNCAYCECDPPIYSRWAYWLGNRAICGAFVFLTYLLNLCWLGIFTFLVGILAIYLSFSPICLPQAGALNRYCLNFTLVNQILGAGEAHAVNLLLCGNPIDTFCKLTRSILPWYWWAYFGCICVLLGLSNFNSCLAANFAHNKRAKSISTRSHSPTSSEDNFTKQDVILNCDNFAYSAELVKGKLQSTV